MSGTAPKRSRGMAGQVTVMFALMLIVLVAIVGFAVDLGGAWGMRTRFDGILESTEQSCMAQANAVKFSNKPGVTARMEVLELLQRNGFTGKVTVWYTEAPESATGAADRWGGVKVRLQGKWGTAFLSVLGTSELPVTSTSIWTYHPYSTNEVYRPADTADGWDSATLIDGVIQDQTHGSLTYETAPDELVDAVEEAMGAA